MEFHPIERNPEDFQQSLALEQIQLVYERAFGAGSEIESVRELGGGEFNNVYLIRPASGEPVVLRVAPPSERFVPWHEEQLMRREHAIHPYLAALAPLLPRTLMVDFTHQLIERDYLFQTYMPGERWSDSDGDLAPQREEILWRQLAHIAKTIHGVEGEVFGHPYPGRQFSTWSATVLAWLEGAARDVEREGLDATAIRSILDSAQANRQRLDEIARPHLAHGDLWSFNVLIDRSAELPRISAVLDYDRAYWGDPQADWMFHLLPRRASPRVREIVLAEYGALEQGPSARVRRLIYDGLHAGNILSYAARRKRESLMARAQAALDQIVADLREPTE